MQRAFIKDSGQWSIFTVLGLLQGMCLVLVEDMIWMDTWCFLWEWVFKGELLFIYPHLVLACRSLVSI